MIGQQLQNQPSKSWILLYLTLGLCGGLLYNFQIAPLLQKKKSLSQQLSSQQLPQQRQWTEQEFAEYWSELLEASSVKVLEQDIQYQPGSRQKLPQSYSLVLESRYEGLLTLLQKISEKPFRLHLQHFEVSKSAGLSTDPLLKAQLKVTTSAPPES